MPFLFFQYCNGVGLCGVRVPGLFLSLGNSPPPRRAAILPLLPARRLVHIKPRLKLVNQYHNAHRCNPSTVYRGFGPSHRLGGVAVLIAGRQQGRPFLFALS